MFSNPLFISIWLRCNILLLTVSLIFMQIRGAGSRMLFEHYVQKGIRKRLENSALSGVICQSYYRAGMMDTFAL